MISAALGLSSAIVAVLVHAAIVRWLPDRWRLLVIPALGLAAFCAVGFFILMSGWRVTPEDCLVGLVLTLSLGLAYALVMIGIFWDSPTLALINAIEDHGSSGMPVEAWDLFVTQHPFVHSRLTALVASGVVADDGELLIYRGKVNVLLQLSDAYRRLCRYDEKAG